ncbi:hypothetical protein BpHYR1_033184 [Brachionus plicatilis]|uniref:Uncharacterized protein n=1 Tax=Brachionus plicatilis TaxID=10195 RepID=A0A3M7QDS9_BRAPC|nr:hypothetical protein BpHYR1_033184 [Brachionus plicatilis]
MHHQDLILRLKKFELWCGIIALNFRLVKNVRNHQKDLYTFIKNLKQLENKIRTLLSNMDPIVVQDYAKSVCFRLDIIRRHGGISLLLGLLKKKFFLSGTNKI